MKKILLGLAIISLLLVGCSNKSEEAYQSAMTDGIQAVADQNYPKAKGYFETALKEKNDDKKAENYLAAVKNYQILLKYQEEEDLEKGLDLSTKLSNDKNVPDTIKKHVQKVGEEFIAIKNTLDESMKLYNEAEKLSEEKKYTESNEKLKVIQNEKLQGTYYKDLIAKTVELSQLNLTEIEKIALAEKEAAEQKAKEEAQKKAAEEKIAKQKAAEQQLASGNEMDSTFSITERQALDIAENFYNFNSDGQQVSFQNMNPGKIFLNEDGSGFYNIYVMIEGAPSAAISVDANTGEANHSIMHFRGLGVEIITVDAP
ncbi:hypothetical protein IGI65_002675 [Enterococcus sp. DIV0755b]|uniref:hypothetical protein n=1 Tax=Enterococcus sp. DIV0755b TaxID=2774657 RepID=UPI003F24C960